MPAWLRMRLCWLLGHKPVPFGIEADGRPETYQLITMICDHCWADTGLT